jgi:hypothetical protein
MVVTEKLVVSASTEKTTMEMVKQIVTILTVVSMDIADIRVERKLAKCASTEKITIRTGLLIVMILIVGKIRVLLGNVGAQKLVRNASMERTTITTIR